MKIFFTILPKKNFIISQVLQDINHDTLIQYFSFLFFMRQQCRCFFFSLLPVSQPMAVARPMAWPLAHALLIEAFSFPLFFSFHMAAMACFTTWPKNHALLECQCGWAATDLKLYKPDVF